VDEAHPAHPFIIRQLTSDEANILTLLNGRQFDFCAQRDYDQTINLSHGRKVEVDELPREMV
jgi:hypothetical protein